MAITQSGLYYITVRNAFQGAAINLSTDTVYGALYTNSITPNFDTDTSYASSPYTSGQSSGAGYVTGGSALATKLHSVSSGTLIYDADDLAWAASTVTARGLLLWDTTPTTPVADPVVCLINFGQDYSTSNGTFTVQFSANGIYRIQLVP